MSYDCANVQQIICFFTVFVVEDNIIVLCGNILSSPCRFAIYISTTFDRN